MLFVVSSPSGAGKTTLCRRLVAEHGDLSFSVSVTTRSMRPGEVDGVDYVFVDDAAFDRMVAEDAFVEWAAVHGGRYGTTWKSIKDALAEGRDVLCDIDWQGAVALKQAFPEDTVMVFVLPPSFAELRRRLTGRRTETEAATQRRLRTAVEELGKYEAYEYFVLNDDLERGYGELNAIFMAQRCSLRQRSALAKMLQREALEATKETSRSISGG